MRRFVSPYKKYVCWAVVLNILSAVFNVFSFSLLIPILNILFKTNAQEKVYQYMDWEWSVDSLKETAINNFYYYVNQLIDAFGPSTTLLFLGLFLAGMTFLKTACYFGSTAVMVPLRTGIVRDIRTMVYSKVSYLPLGFFSEERKGDIIARMSGDVAHTDDHQLAAYGIYHSGSANYGLAYGKDRPQTEKTVTRSSGKMGRNHVSAGRNTGRTAYHQGIYG